MVKGKQLILLLYLFTLAYSSSIVFLQAFVKSFVDIDVLSKTKVMASLIASRKTQRLWFSTDNLVDMVKSNCHSQACCHLSALLRVIGNQFQSTRWKVFSHSVFLFGNFTFYSQVTPFCHIVYWMSSSCLTCRNNATVCSVAQFPIKTELKWH